MLNTICSRVSGGDSAHPKRSVSGSSFVKKMHAPAIVDPRNDRLALRCEYDLHGNELYSVNWYRNENVLFRYSPSLEPKGQVFPSVADLNVSLEHSNAEQLLLMGHKDPQKSQCDNCCTCSSWPRRFCCLHSSPKNLSFFSCRHALLRGYVSVRSVDREPLPHGLRHSQRQRRHTAQRQSDPRRVEAQLPGRRDARRVLHLGAEYAPCRGLFPPQRTQGKNYSCRFFSH